MKSEWHTPCPKCESKNTRLRKTEDSLYLSCLCGWNRLLFTTLQDTLEGDLGTDEENSIKLPKPGTAAYKTLVVVSIMHGANSREITQRLNELNGIMRVPGTIFRKDLVVTVSDVSSYLTILKSKQLVDRIEVRRGVPGGSSWKLTQDAIELLDIQEEFEKTTEGE